MKDDLPSLRPLIEKVKDELEKSRIKTAKERSVRYAVKRRKNPVKFKRKK